MKPVNKTNILLKWTVLSFVFISVSYMVSLFAVLFIHGAFGFTMDEEGTRLSQTLSITTGSLVAGLGVGIYQKSLLSVLFPVKKNWILAILLGFLTAELLIALILWPMGLIRGDLRFIEGNALTESLFFGLSGLLIGILQLPILKKYFTRSYLWVAASAIGWFAAIAVCEISIWMFFFGTVLYGIITGVCLLWLMGNKKDAIQTGK